VYDGDILYVRLSGSDAGVRAARFKLGGDSLEKNETFWKELREQQISFFRNDTPLWRLSVPPATAPIDLPGKWLLDWGGAQRWLKTDSSAQDIRNEVGSAGGLAMPCHAIEMKKTQNVELSKSAQALQRNLKLSFDPANILNTA
jgi:glycolate oxidase FAD binding subunit